MLPLLFLFCPLRHMHSDDTKFWAQGPLQSIDVEIRDPLVFRTAKRRARVLDTREVRY